MATFSKTNTNGRFTLRLTLTDKADGTSSTNKSTVAYSLDLIANTTSNFIDYCIGRKVTINGVNVINVARSDSAKLSIADKGTLNLGKGTTTIAHNTDGTKTINFSFSCDMSSTYAGALSNSGSLKLADIKRMAVLTSAQDFTHLDNPKITYNNSLGNNATKVEVGIFNNAGTVGLAAYREISKTGSNYTFTLTAAEKNALKATTLNSKSSSVKFYIRTNGNSTLVNSMSKTFSIKSGTDTLPLLNPTVVDTNTTTQELTVDTNIIVKGYSNVMVKSGASAQYGATIKSQRIVNDGKVLTADGIFEGVQSGIFEFTVTDSRGFVTTQKVTKTIIDYFKPTINFTVDNPVVANTPPQGKAHIKINGTCFNGSFGTVTNAFKVYIRCCEEDNEFSKWTEVTNVTRNGNDFSKEFDYTVTDYEKRYTFQVEIMDSLNDVFSQKISVKSIPVFDWGENDFRFNVPAYVGNNEIFHMGNLKIAMGKTLVSCPSAKTVGNTIVSFPDDLFSSAPIVLLTPVTAAPGSNVIEVGVSNVSSTQCQINLYRTDTTATGVNWFAIQQGGD